MSEVVIPYPLIRRSTSEREFLTPPYVAKCSKLGGIVASPQSFSLLSIRQYIL
jgi:hypothetical protein